MLTEDDPLPWYRQFWPWFLIAVPLVSMMVGTLLLVLANTTEDSLVKDDYYKQGKAINNTFQLLRKASELGITATIAVNDKSVMLRFLTGEPVDQAALTLDFYHATLATKDTTLLLSRSLDGIYRASLERPLDGKWKITLTPFHGEWKIQQVVELPSAGDVLLQP